jgi:type II secretory pathway pseudopilin PulG
VRKGGDEGESLVEIVIALVLIGLVVSALMAGLATAARASKSQRDLVLMDTVMRSYAEAIKHQVREDCDSPDSPVLAYQLVPYAPPAGIAIAQDPAIQSCPTITVNRTLELSVTKGSLQRKMSIEIRKP